MTALRILAWVAAGLAAWLLLVAVPLAFTLGAVIRRADRHRTAPDRSAGDLLADVPVSCLSDDAIAARFYALTDPIEAEIDKRWAS